MSFPEKLLTVCAIGAALMIVGCGSGSTHLHGAQAAEAGSAVITDAANMTITALQARGGVIAVGGTPTTAGGAINCVTPATNVNGSTTDTETCTLASSSLPCFTSGTFTGSGKFNDTFNTTAPDSDIVDNLNLSLTNFNNCVDKDPAIKLTGGSLTIKTVAVGPAVNTLNLDTTGTAALTPQVTANFEITVTGHLTFAPGPTDTASLRARSVCSVSLDLTFTGPAAATVNKATSFCGNSIAANTVEALNVAFQP